MFLNFLRFEVKYWLRRPMPYVFLALIGFMIFGATVSDSIRVGGSYGNVFKNAPYVIFNLSGTMSLLGLLIITSFVSATALRNQQYQFSELVFTKPISKSSYLLGGLFGSLLVCIVPFLGISLGVLLGSISPWIDAARVGENTLWPHIAALLQITIPNIIIGGLIIYAIALFTRNSMATYIGSIAILVLYIISGNFTSDLDNEWIGILSDPFGLETLRVYTKYFTVAERNSVVLWMGDKLIINRLLWMSIAGAIFFVAYKHYSFQVSDKKTSNKKVKPENELAPVERSNSAQYIPRYSAIAQLLNKTKGEIQSIIRTPAFIILTLVGVLNLGSALATATDFYGVAAFPVTYIVLDLIKGSFFLFSIAILTFYSGALVWKEREAKMDEIYDALPYPSWINFTSKLLALLLIMFILNTIAMGESVIGQALMGYTNFEWKLYFVDLWGLSMLGYFNLAVIAILMQVITNNKYVGYFAFIAFLIVDGFIWGALHVETYLVNFSGSPEMTYSDMNGYGPNVLANIWFRSYWLLIALLISVLTAAFWVRGKQINLKYRIASAWQDGKQFKAAVYGLGLTIFLVGAFIFYNTKVVNKIVSDKEGEQIQVNYELNYKKYQNYPHPDIIKADYNIDLYPAERNLVVKAEFEIKNNTTSPIDSIMFSLPFNVEADVFIGGSQLMLFDSTNHFAIYKLNRALEPGETLHYTVNSSHFTKGFKNDDDFTQVVRNGSFFNNTEIVPSIGYNSGYELADRNKRKDNNLPERERMAPLEENCTDNCMYTYIGSDAKWLNLSCTFSTSEDQIAIAPGSLVKEWSENGRRYFRYVLEQKALNFYSFLSAQYEVKREKWNDVDLEVYYFKNHAYNVDKMMASMRSSLKYYSESFGPYPHKQTRIIEFPRYAQFAQAFPGTMPYSEAIGFISNLEDEEDIDMVYYVVAHEMAHQWWAHQVIGPDMQGSTLLSETFAQYSAIMMMEHAYGRDQIHKFLKYELDGYLRGRGRELEKEMPLLKVENQQYIHYKKGSLVMYSLKEYLGEEKVNSVLKFMVDSFGYKEPPFPTSLAFYNRLKAETPDSLHYLLTDLFEEITLYGNRCKEAKAVKLDNGSYEVTVNYEFEKLKADSTGTETPVAINDWIDVAVYAAPEDGKKYGKVLDKKRIKVTQKEQAVVFVVSEKPEKAAVDPDYLLVDRMPKDNEKTISFEE